MNTCMRFTKDMLSNPIEIITGPGSVDFGTARIMSDHKAKEVTDDPMLLAWFDRKAGTYSPNVICCDTSKPTWLLYAESCGGTIGVNVNDGEYVFVYREGLPDM